MTNDAEQEKPSVEGACTDEPSSPTRGLGGTVLFYASEPKGEPDTTDSKGAKRRPVLSSSLKKKETITHQDIEKKLKQAEQRRKNKLENRSKRVVENRENMFAFVDNLHKLSDIREASKENKKNNHCDPSEKREYAQLCYQVSNYFERLSSRYDSDLQTAYEAKEFLDEVQVPITCPSQVPITTSSSRKPQNQKEILIPRKPQNQKEISIPRKPLRAPVTNTVKTKCKPSASFFADVAPDKEVSKIPMLTSSLRNNRARPTKEEIERKLVEAEERRKKRLESRCKKI